MQIEDADALCNLANYYYKDGRIKKAEKSYKKALKIEPNNSKAWMNLANIYIEYGSYEDAENTYRQAVEAVPSDAILRNDFAYFLWRLEKNSDAEIEAREAVKHDPDYSYANATLGLLLFERDLLDEGRECYEKAIKLEPKDKELQQKFYYEYGRALGRNEKNAEAAKYLNDAKNVDTDYVSIEEIEAELAKLDEAK